MKVSFAGKTIIAVASLLLTARVASASECVVPQFNPDQHTYISPTLEQDPKLRDELNGLSAELVATGNPHKIIPYFVACQMNYQQGVPGVQYSHDVFDFWKSNAAFQSQGNVVVIAWVRNGLDTNHGSVGATAGQSLQDLGFTGDYFASSGGPVLNVIREYMPNDPKGEFVHIVREIGDEIDVQKEAAERQQEQAKRDAIEQEQLAESIAADIPYALGGVALCLLLWLGVRLWRAHQRNEAARDSIRKKDADITTALNQVDADFGVILTEQGIRSASHVNALTELRTRQQQIAKELRSNPRGSMGAAATLLEDANHLKAEVHRSLTIQTSTLPALNVSIAHARETITTTRQSVISYAFHGVDTPAGLIPFLRLEAKGGNPDEMIASALKSIASARTCLTDGKIDEAQVRIEAARRHISDANSLIKNTLMAKEGAETIVATILDAKSQLLLDCEGGEQPLKQLKSEFAPVNFESVVNNIEKAKKVAQSVDAVITEAAAQYFQQDFLASKTLLDNLLHDLNAAKTGVGDISSRLKDLMKKRAILLSKVGGSGQTLEMVSAKLRKNRSHASSRTKQGYARLQEQQKALSQVSNDGSPINWLAMWLIWESFSSNANAVSSHIDSDRSSYESSQRASEASRSYQDSPTFSIDTSSTSSIGGSGGGNY
jgi:hypothetical protein